MNKENIEEIAKALYGISYTDWLKIKEVVEKKITLHKGKLKLTDIDGVKKMLELELLEYKEN